MKKKKLNLNNALNVCLVLLTVIVAILALSFIGAEKEAEKEKERIENEDRERAVWLAEQPDIEVDKCSYSYDDYTGYRVTAGGTVKNNSGTIKEVYLKIGIYNSDGVQVGWTNDIVTIPGGETARWEATTYTDYDFDVCRIIDYSAY